MIVGPQARSVSGNVMTTSAARTFKRRREADAYARTVEADRLRGLVIDPRAGLVTVESYALM